MNKWIVAAIVILVIMIIAFLFWWFKHGDPEGLPWPDDDYNPLD